MKYQHSTLTPRIALNEALGRIAQRFGFDHAELIAYAEDDEIGGYHSDDSQRRITEDGKLAKGIWGVEGQIIYALIRASTPRHVLEVGNCWGTSTLHIGEAVLTNGKGKLTTLDLPEPSHGGDPFTIPERYEGITTAIYEDLFDFNYKTRPLLDFVFEDALHATAQVAHVWGNFAQYAKSGAVIVSHDSEHHQAGVHVQAGIEQVVAKGEYLSLAIAPADCGLAMWRKP